MVLIIILGIKRKNKPRIPPPSILRAITFRYQLQVTHNSSISINDSKAKKLLARVIIYKMI